MGDAFVKGVYRFLIRCKSGSALHSCVIDLSCGLGWICRSWVPLSIEFSFQMHHLELGTSWGLGEVCGRSKWWSVDIGGSVQNDKLMTWWPRIVDRKYRKGTSIWQAPVYRHLRALQISPCMEVYYLVEWIIITLHVAGFLHPVIIWYFHHSSDKSGLKITHCTVQSAEYWCSYGIPFFFGGVGVGGSGESLSEVWDNSFLAILDLWLIFKNNQNNTALLPTQIWVSR